MAGSLKSGLQSLSRARSAGPTIPSERAPARRRRDRAVLEDEYASELRAGVKRAKFTRYASRDNTKKKLLAVPVRIHEALQAVALASSVERNVPEHDAYIRALEIGTVALASEHGIAVHSATDSARRAHRPPAAPATSATRPHKRSA